jgi:ABC-2 type transport system permease protein
VSALVSGRVSLAVAHRVLLQLRRDHRTLVMLLVLPCAIIALLRWMFSAQAGVGFEGLAPALLALIPFVVMFLVTSVTTLRERSSGTLERLLAMPMGKGDFLVGYALAFGVVAAVQSALAVGVSIWWLGLDIAGPTWLLLVVAVLDAVLGSALGLFVSAFARTEFQAVQFMPALVFPQMLLCGLFIDRSRLPGFLHTVSDCLPLSYAVDAMRAVSTRPHPSVLSDLAIVAGFTAAALVLGALTLRRRTP